MCHSSGLQDRCGKAEPLRGASALPCNRRHARVYERVRVSFDFDDDWAPAAGFVRPPTWVAYAIGAALLSSTVLLLWPGRLAHWTGYVLGIWVTAGLGILHRHIAASSRRDNPASYMSNPPLDQAVMGLLIVGCLVGALHAYYALRVVVVAS